jgi:hypothetical protein
VVCRGAKPPPYKDPDDGRQRFLLELEFIQCLANPIYINCTVPLPLSSPLSRFT